MAYDFNLLAIAQSGRLQAEAVLWLTSLREADPTPNYRVFVAEPAPGPLWSGDPGIDDAEIRDRLTALDATIVRFDNRHFGADYAYGNKIEALFSLPRDQPFLFTDTDTLWLSALSQVPFDFTRPSASSRRTGTWPKVQPDGADMEAIWGSLYDRFDLDFPASQDTRFERDDWQRYLYFNAGFFFGTCPHRFGEQFLSYTLSIRDSPPEALSDQKLNPWLDQIALPLVISAQGGGRESLEEGWLDGRTSLHYRTLPLLFACESDEAIATLNAIATPNRTKKLLKRYPPFHRMIYRGDGAKVRALFDEEERSLAQDIIRKRIRAAGLWMR